MILINSHTVNPIAKTFEEYQPFTPVTYTDFSYESLRIAQIHGSFTDPYDLATFTTDLRVVMSYYELLTISYGLLRFLFSFQFSFY